MRNKAILLSLISLIFWSLSACESEKETSQALPASQPIAKDLDEEPVDESPVEEVDVFQGPTCQELNIPSWERRIRRLSDELCVRCHNANFAWNGARLDTYQEFVRNSAGAIERVRTRDLTITINVLEAAAFIDWYEAGMPETEKSCATDPSL